MTVMWEARAAAGRAAELLAFVLAHAHPSAAVYRSTVGPDHEPERLVVIDPTDVGVVGVPSELLARPPHAWRFDVVDRG